MSDLFVDNIKHQSSQGSGTITIGSSGEKIDLGATAGGTFTMTPAFSAYISSAQTIPTATWTKLQFNTEDFDTDSTYDNSTNYRFTPALAGKYQIQLAMSFNNFASDNRNLYAIWKNGSQMISKGDFEVAASSNADPGVQLSTIDVANTTDYYEAYVYHEKGSDVNTTLGRQTNFSAFRLIGA